MPKQTITSLAFDLEDPKDRQDFIHVLMRRRGITIQDLADENEVVRSMISTVLAGQKKSSRIREAIARRLDFEPHVLWSDEAEEAADM